MNRAARAFLIWAMVIAMPMQGMAASLMLFCGPSHARMMRGLAADTPAHEHAAAGHDHAAMLAAGSAADAGDAASQQPDLTCSACAACCSVLALPMSFSLPAATGVSHAVQTAPPAPRPSHEPDGLERPPRSTRA